ncbi:NXPE family member 3-like [Petromyzon marinus]|uniref:NXPE family member 3-like n=1 Tax=Petromyzon marinus TaxID=7757 RepID=UPI003F72623F
MPLLKVSLVLPPPKKPPCHVKPEPGPRSSTPEQRDPEMDDLKQLLRWSNPPSTSSFDFESSTSPAATSYRLLGGTRNFTVGDTLHLTVQARDHHGRDKRHGGDYFRIKVYSQRLRVGTFGSVLDHDNGSYTASVVLLWPGEALVDIKLVHSSEAVHIMSRLRDSVPNKIFFTGYFEKEGARGEATECNAVPLFQAKGGTCEYRDAATGHAWFCARPTTLPCDSLRFHSDGGRRKVLTNQEERLFSKNLIANLVHGIRGVSVIQGKCCLDQELFQVFVVEALNAHRQWQNACDGVVSHLTMHVHPPLIGCSRSAYVHVFPCVCAYITEASLGPCVPGHPVPSPSGYYLNDEWVSLACRARPFPAPQDLATCLRRKRLYLFGDSTIRQWFEHISTHVPGGCHGFSALWRRGWEWWIIKMSEPRDLRNPSSTHMQLIDIGSTHLGPLISANVAAAKTFVMYRTHGPPFLTAKRPFAALHYAANELDGLAGQDAPPTLLDTEESRIYIATPLLKPTPGKHARVLIAVLVAVSSRPCVLTVPVSMPVYYRSLPTPGGKDTVVGISLWAHFTGFPVSFYVTRMRGIRAAVVRLLKRAPGTLVVFKSANTSYHSVYQSDWLSLQLDLVMRRLMAGLPVVILDAWEMTAAHRFPDNLHPDPVIIHNEIKLLLAFVCPQ